MTRWATRPRGGVTLTRRHDVLMADEALCDCVEGWCAGGTRACEGFWRTAEPISGPGSFGPCPWSSGTLGRFRWGACRTWGGRRRGLVPIYSAGQSLLGPRSIVRGVLFGPCGRASHVGLPFLWLLAFLAVRYGFSVCISRLMDDPLPPRAYAFFRIGLGGVESQAHRGHDLHARHLHR